uniref:Uncharacterized protein n=1 Tax=Magallana gigas TaxID=29159 RepID=K1QST5_MAGGI
MNGDCAGTNVDGTHKQAWWNISLPDLANIYKINLMFREKYIRHYGYYVFINKEDINIEGLASLTPVYHEENEKHPGVQNIIMFPGGIQGKQMYIYQNKSNATGEDSGDLKNNVLDICEVEIWACPKDAYNATTTDVENSGQFMRLSVDDYFNYTCKIGHRFESGNLIRICQENGSWSGEEPICKRCKCPCERLASQNFIKDPIVLQKRIEETKKFLAVNRSELSAFQRKKISSYDGRASSTGIGMTLGKVTTKATAGFELRMYGSPVRHTAMEKSALCKNKSVKAAATPTPMLRACDLYTCCAVEYSHDPNLYLSKSA